MTHIIILTLVAFILLYLNIKNMFKYMNITNSVYMFLNVIGILILPVYYIITESKIPLTAYILYALLAIILPVTILVLEKFTKLKFSELLAIRIFKIMYFLGDKKGAKEFLSLQIERHPDSYIFHKTLGETYEKEGGIRKSIKEYEEAIKINRKDYGIFFKIIVLMQDLEKKEEAIELLKRLISVRKDYDKAYILLGKMLNEIGDLKESAKYLKEGFENNSDNEEIAYFLGYTYLKLNEFLMAKEYFKKAIDINPKLSYIHLNIAQLYILEKEYKEGEIYLNQAIKDSAIEDICLYEKAKIKVLERNEEEALELLNKALDINPELINKINANILFKNIKEDTVVKVVLVNKERPKLDDMAVECINILENVMQLALFLDDNEKKKKLSDTIENIIESKKDIEKEAEMNFTKKEFIRKHIENVEAEVNLDYEFVKKAKEKEDDE